MTYKEKLNDPLWRLRKSQILARDAWVCADCYTTDSIMQVHHLYYEYGNDPWEYPDSALITLCKHCHASEHERFNNYKGIRRDPSLKKLGFRAKDYENLLFALLGEKIGLLPKNGGAIQDCLKMIKRRQDNHLYHIELRRKETGMDYQGEWIGNDEDFWRC